MDDPKRVPKRPNYFQSQFLVVRDFKDEQSYHEESLRRHNRLMHEWGVIGNGLQVKSSGDNFVITVGSAVDRSGREIVLETERTITAAQLKAAREATGAGTDVDVTIKFKEVGSTDTEDKYPPDGVTENVTRMVQSPDIAVTKSSTTDDTVVILARIALNNAINNSVRKVASSVIPRGANLNLGDVTVEGGLSFTSNSTPTVQMGLDFNSAGDHLRIKARTASGSTLDTTYLTIQRGSGYVGIGTAKAASQKLEVAGALKLTDGPIINNDNVGAYFWDQPFVGPTIAGKNFEVRTGGNAASLRINSYGNVGIGTETTEPQSKLHIVGLSSGLPSTSGSSQSGGKVLRLRGKTNAGVASPVLDIGSGGDKGFWLQSTDPADLTKNYPLLLNPNGGNVGIGTTDAPQQKLEVIGALRLGGAPQVTPDDKAAYFWNQEHVGPTIGGFGFEVRTGSDTPRFKINSAGNVGIGTTELGARLHVVGTGSASPAMSGSAQSAGLVARLRGTTNAGTPSPVLDIGSAGDKGFWLQSTDPADLTKKYPLILNPTGGDIGIGGNLSIGNNLGVGGNLSIAHNVDINGNVGIGTNTPKSLLHIRKDNEKGLGPTLTLMNGSGHNGAKVHIDLYTYWNSSQQLPSGRIICEDNEGGSGHLIFQTLNTAANPNKMEDRMKIDAATGDVAIGGKISCGGKIGIKSAEWENRWISARPAKESWLVLTHDAFKEYEEFTIVMACSREFKENISDLTALEAMTTLQNLTPVKYDYKGEKTFRQNLGFIAEDMPDNLSSEDRKSISPFEVVPILTRVAKEQQRVIDELQETVRTLQDAVLG